MNKIAKTILLLAMLSTTIFAAQRVCGDRVYNDSKQYCLLRYDKLYLYDYKYCGKEKYKPITENLEFVCVKGEVLRECGRTGYNNSTHYCVDGKPVPKEVIDKKKRDSIQNITDTHEKFTDPRDNRVYSTKKLGENTWILENLRFPVPYNGCYRNYDEAPDCAKAGRGYSDTRALEVCPSGWHLPNDADWEALKAIWATAKNDFLITNDGGWWSTDKEDDHFMYFWKEAMGGETLVRGSSRRDGNRHAVRCVKGEAPPPKPKEEKKEEKKEEPERVKVKIIEPEKEKTGLEKLKFW